MGHSTSRLGDEAAVSARARTRVELVGAVFRTYDLDADGILRLPELRQVVEHAGLARSAAEWAAVSKRFESVCAESGRSPVSGADLKLFERLVGEGSEEGPCYCSTDRLQMVLDKAQATLATAASAPEPSAPNTAQSRRALIQTVFRAFDLDGDARLNEAELRLFLRHAGFEEASADQEWAETYGLLCAGVGCDARAGVDAQLFARLVSDDSDDGCYCTTSELRSALERIQAETAQTVEAKSDILASEVMATKLVALTAEVLGTRAELVRAVFSACDGDEDGRLNSGEMRRFVEQTGSDVTDDEWAEEYANMCSESGGDPHAGFGGEAFEQIVDEFTDEELRAMLNALRQD